MSMTVFPPLPQIPSGLQTIRIDSDQALMDLEEEMRRTLPTPKRVVRRKSRLAEQLKSQRKRKLHKKA